MAERVPGAKLVELPGIDHIPWVGDQDALLDGVEEFLTGTRPHAPVDRVLATVLFTDICGSTALAAEFGNRRWRDLLQSYDSLARREIDRARGRENRYSRRWALRELRWLARAIRRASAIVSAVRSLGITVRAGLHIGECELIGEKIGGIAVHIGARVAAIAGPGEVLVSHTVRDLSLAFGSRTAERTSSRECPGPGHCLP